jgi:hypothetical protein
MENKKIVELIERCFAFVKSNLDDFNEALDENYTEEDIESCAEKCIKNV